MPLLRFRSAILGAFSIGLLLAACTSNAHAAARLQPDSAAMRADLLRRVTRFHRTWREVWQASMIDRKQVIVNLELLRNDLAYGNVTYEGLRYQSILCSAGWLGEAELAAAQANPQGGDQRVDLSVPRPTATERLLATLQAPGTAAPDPEAALPLATAPVPPGPPQALNLLSSRRVRGDLDKGQVCPQWVPDGVGLPIDEGERIDFALPVAVRPRITRARDSLITRLAEAQALFPGDDWIVGQLVRFQLDNADVIGARRTLATCGGTPTWCEALRGLVLAQAGESGPAEAAFRRADAAAVLGVRGTCADTSAFALLPDGPRREAHGLPCEEQRALEARLWWLADPLWSVPGNPRYTEHQRRLTTLALRSRFDEDERYVWRRTGGGEALRETVVRYGWPTHTYWGGYLLDEQLNKGRSRVMMQPNPPYTAKEYAPDRVTLLPTWSALEAPLRAVPDDWQLVRPESMRLTDWWPAEHMALAPRIYTLPDGQMATLRRDHTLRLAMAVDDPVRGLEGDVATLPGVQLLASTGPDALAVVADTTFTIGAPLRVIGDYRGGATLLSLEVPGRVPLEVSHRRRFGFQPPPTLAELPDDALAVSEPVIGRLDQPGDAVPIDPDDVLRRMAGTLSFARDTPLALYWESYGIAVGDTADVEVRIARRDDRSALRAFGAFFGVADARRDSISIRWREPDPGRAAVAIATRIPTVGRALALNVSNLAPGRYAFIVVMTRRDGTRAQAEREIEVRP